ncbi:thioredoxin family protein [Aporhodopirellula aestuarii]|uniref:Thioredoxin family protein n=1 Tax=Aporhodopirellula aestuarii TaxID=2950107 RepID=A0ABT0UC30_9BACT|nr:thioredoxin family protein [Aporhodopirellula aestuarii]MCM2374274.1 thioredoxin family protein [Aporhodopirellula aestuarii]
MIKKAFLPIALPALLLCLFFVASTGCKPPAPTEPAEAVTQTRFDQTINQDKLILVKFGATWCPPCRDVDQELKMLSGQLPEDVEVLKIDVDENPELAQRYGISSIPKLMLVRNGEILSEEIGYMSGDRIQSWIAEYRGNTP